MQTITVNTGYGYYRNAQGRVVSKAELPPGPHPLENGLSYIEVADAGTLDQIQIHRDPAEIEKQQNEQKIQDHARQKAIAELKATGDLPPDFVG